MEVCLCPAWGEYTSPRFFVQGDARRRFGMWDIKYRDVHGAFCGKGAEEDGE